jgi:Fur family ferric uptake transcriptional regulator
MTMVSDDRATTILDQLRGRGGRVTAPRRRVIEAMLAAPSHHLTAADIVEAVRETDPAFYESTVYRTLDRLVELSVVERVQIGQGAAIFHLPHRPHHHLVCECCGDVTEVSADLLDDLAGQVKAQHAFVLRPSASTLVGSCRRCARAAGHG